MFLILIRLNLLFCCINVQLKNIPEIPSYSPFKVHNPPPALWINFCCGFLLFARRNDLPLSAKQVELNITRERVDICAGKRS
jgi:hypothetical protein